MTVCRQVAVNKHGTIQVCFSRRDWHPGRWSISINERELVFALRREGGSHTNTLRDLIGEAKKTLGDFSAFMFTDEDHIGFLAGMLVEAYDRGKSEQAHQS